jgi:uncharacterized protein DUF6448
MQKLLMVFIAVIFAPVLVSGHCDTLGGPVIADAKLALEKGDVTPVLKWIRKADEQEVKAVFDKTIAVRPQSDNARELADTYFFETLVRIHRAGEGAPFTGLKPASAMEPEIVLTDKALANASAEALIASVTSEVTTVIRTKFDHVLETKKHANDSVEQGREYVEAYVEFLHYVEHLHEGPLAGHQ